MTDQYYLRKVSEVAINGLDGSEETVLDELMEDFMAGNVRKETFLSVNTEIIGYLTKETA